MQTIRTKEAFALQQRTGRFDGTLILASMTSDIANESKRCASTLYRGFNLVGYPQDCTLETAAYTLKSAHFKGHPLRSACASVTRCAGSKALSCRVVRCREETQKAHAAQLKRAKEDSQKAQAALSERLNIPVLAVQCLMIIA